MPAVSPFDQTLLHISNSNAAALATLAGAGNRYPFPVAQLIIQATSDRIALAGEHLRAGDATLKESRFRAAIGRHYYAMYHAARAVVFGDTLGDDHERHSNLPRHLPTLLADRAARERELVAARLLRNEADYDPYPGQDSEWESDARTLSVTAAEFVQACEDFALANGLV